MNTLKHRLTRSVMALAELTVGILLLIDPVAFTSGILGASGLVLILCGIWNTIKYFRSFPEEACAKQLLAKGLALLLAGVLCAFGSGRLIDFSHVLSQIYGIGILFVGLIKTQWAADMLRLKQGSRLPALVSAAASLVCGIVIIAVPFGSADVLWKFAAIGLIVSAVPDILAAVLDGGRKKEED